MTCEHLDEARHQTNDDQRHQQQAGEPDRRRPSNDHRLPRHKCHYSKTEQSMAHGGERRRHRSPEGKGQPSTEEGTNQQQQERDVGAAPGSAKSASSHRRRPQLPGPGLARLLHRRSGSGMLPPRHRRTWPAESRLGEYHVRSQLRRPPQEDVHPLVDVLRWRAVYRPGVQEGNLDQRLLVGTQRSGRLPTTDSFRVRPRRDPIRQAGHPADLVRTDPAEFRDLGQSCGRAACPLDIAPKSPDPTRSPEAAT